ncbi:MAG: response regulator [Verrucomicrobiota bacterium]|nr:response regulator [Verrucomicrobiota bacterium]
MLPPEVRVLILEDDPILSSFLRDEFTKAIPEIGLLFARSIAEAELLINQYEIHIFVLDVNLPDGNGLDFLSDVKTVDPYAKAIIMTAYSMPEIRKRAIELGTMTFLEKPFDIEDLAQAMRTIAIPNAQESSQRFQGSLKHLQLIDIIQLKCLGKATSCLKVVNAMGQTGLIFFKDGNVVHAQTGVLQGVQAFFDVIQWKGGNIIEMDPPPPLGRETISEKWEKLILEGLRQIEDHQQNQS